MAATRDFGCADHERCCSYGRLADKRMGDKLWVQRRVAGRREG
jgi:hypothetical protein